MHIKLHDTIRNDDDFLFLALVKIKYKVYPISAIAKVGSSKTFWCTFERESSWNFKGGSLLRNVKTGKENGKTYLKIINIKTKNSGTYQCNSEEDLLIYQAEAVLEVFGTG